MPRPQLREPRYRLRRRGRYWTLSWTDPERHTTVALSTRATELQAAEAWRDQYLAGLAQPLPPAEPRITDILDGYLDARKSKVAAYDRLEFGARVIRRLAGNLEPHMLTPGFYAEKRGREDVGDGTVRREIAVLRAALHWATRQQPPWIDRAPYIEAPPAPAPRDRWLSRAEVGRLVAAATRPHLRLFVLLAYHTAARAGAILDLTWDRVDLDAARIAYDRPGRQRTKKRRATVPVNAPLASALETARGVATEEKDEAGRPQSPHVIQFHGKPVRSVKKAFGEACRRAGIEDCSPHTLRHTAATHMVMAGVPLAQIARLLGDTEATIERVYAKHAPNYLEDAVNALAGRLGGRS